MTSQMISTCSSIVVDDERRRLWRDTFCKGATDQELDLFIAVCARTCLSPENRQIWAIKQWDKNLGREVLRAQTSVDGFRVIAERSGKYAGQLGPFWCDNDGVWVDVWLKPHPPVAAKVGILKTDWREPLWSVARWDSFAAKDKNGNLTNFWAKMPDLMLAKVAESQGLRRAFPNDLSGIYTKEEMEQANVWDLEPQTPEQPKPTALPPPEPTPPPPPPPAEKPKVLFTKQNPNAVKIAKEQLGKALDEKGVERAIELLEGRTFDKPTFLEVIEAVKLEKEIYEVFAN